MGIEKEEREMGIENAINQINALIARSKSEDARSYMAELVRCLEAGDASWQCELPLHLRRSSAVRDARALAWTCYYHDPRIWIR